MKNKTLDKSKIFWQATFVLVIIKCYITALVSLVVEIHLKNFSSSVEKVSLYWLYTKKLKCFLSIISLLYVCSTVCNVLKKCKNDKQNT